MPSSQGSHAAVVAVEMGLRYIGYEISARYIRIAENRIRTARIERRLLDEMEARPLKS